MKPAVRMRRTIAASLTGTYSANARDENVVRIPAVSVRSLTSIGTPRNGPSGRLVRSAASNASVTRKFSSGFVASIRAIAASASSRGETSPARTCAASASASCRQTSGQIHTGPCVPDVARAGDARRTVTAPRIRAASQRSRQRRAISGETP